MSETAKTVNLEQTAKVDVEKQQEQQQNEGTKTNTIDDNNHFFEEKVKERAPPGINGSLVFLYGLLFSMFTIGCVNINKCPLNRLIPIFLINIGAFGALAKFLSKFENKWCYWTASFLIVIYVAWHGVGTIIVYREYQPSYLVQDPNYCNRTAYLVAFWTLTIEYTLFCFFLLLSCCYMMMRRDFRTESGTK